MTLPLHMFHRGACLACGHSPKARTTSCPVAPPGGLIGCRIGDHRGTGVFLVWERGAHPREAASLPGSEAWLWCAEWLEEVLVEHWEKAAEAPGADGRSPLALAHLAINTSMSHARWHSIGRMREMLACLATRVEAKEGIIAITLEWWSMPWDNPRARGRDEGKEAWVGVGESP